MIDGPFNLTFLLTTRDVGGLGDIKHQFLQSHSVEANLLRSSAHPTLLP